MEPFKSLAADWRPPEIPADIARGDMPGDQICINQEHVRKARVIFPELTARLAALSSPGGRAVASICGGSGVGKSEIASVLGYYLRQMGAGAYILSGDNYPRRIPRDNDAERLRVFRVCGLRGLIDSGCYQEDMGAALRELWREEKDADLSIAASIPWLSVYQQAGRRALSGYLGTPAEIDFDEINGVIARFKQGARAIALKRMGRDRLDLWYDNVDFSAVQVLIVEWTHGNSAYLRGVDLPILLNSTPEETLMHRRARNRDGKTDSAFTDMVLKIEQQKLEEQADKAKIILSKSGELLDYADYRRLMAGA